MIQQSGLFGGPAIPSMRYQQVCSASLFTNVDPALVYVTTLTCGPSPNHGLAWTVPRMQINLSTTSNKVDGLSLVFQENVGADDLVVFGPAAWHFGLPFTVPLARPFHYDPTKGNLLMDVRIFEVGPPDSGNAAATLWAYDSPTDEVSRVWATNVTATAADGADTVGLFTIFQLSPVPSLSIQAYLDRGTNFIMIQWPTQPTVFTFQRSTRLGAGASWQPVTDAPSYSNAVYQRYWFPASSTRGNAFYRLIWPSGH
jgi:hypothetical protein